MTCLEALGELYHDEFSRTYKFSVGYPYLRLLRLYNLKTIIERFKHETRNKQSLRIEKNNIGITIQWYYEQFFESKTTTKWVVPKYAKYETRVSEVDHVQVTFEENGHRKRVGGRVPRRLGHLFDDVVRERHVKSVIGTAHVHRVVSHVHTDVRHAVAGHFYVDHHRLAARRQRGLRAHLQRKTNYRMSKYLHRQPLQRIF